MDDLPNVLCVAVHRSIQVHLVAGSKCLEGLAWMYWQVGQLAPPHLFIPWIVSHAVSSLADVAKFKPKACPSAICDPFKQLLIVILANDQSAVEKPHTVHSLIVISTSHRLVPEGYEVCRWQTGDHSSVGTYLQDHAASIAGGKNITDNQNK